MNVKKSRYASGTCPKSMMINMEAVDRGIRYYSETIYPDGRAGHSRTPPTTMAQVIAGETTACYCRSHSSSSTPIR
jgi:hypothetical protein